ncbi:hypothetical protein FB567DRAFT_333223 [Paraphoma chrysanthemicola]|uniref:Heterokaryon incompatibility domain-containing protein n=1 Tax=Paraphoma chrysanthemicola TaxID=798071 RepID=A0A8K0R6L5_9PLEO|nr:hypothetical protein FB567DRAFT_333223 [Paraphoma chrysanthemicola]
MADIYESAVVTLAATKSANPSEGCFSTTASGHDPRYMSIPSGKFGIGNTTVQIREALPNAHQSYYMKLPLFSRAWAFQERRLSPRVIHFTERELGWECAEGNWCECSSPFPLFAKEHQLGRTVLDASVNIMTWHIEWQKIVSEYSGKNLTYSRDISPALQGLAQRYSPVMGHYLAGLWDKTLIYSLTWYRHDLRSPSNPGPLS